MMASYRILCCVKIFLFNVALIIAADQVTERSRDQKTNLTYSESQTFRDKEVTLFQGNKKVKLLFHIELSHLYQNVLKNENADSFTTMDNYTKFILSPTDEMIQKLQTEYQEREIPLSIYKTIFKRFSGLNLNETNTNSLILDLPTKKGIPKVKDKDSFLKIKIKTWMAELIGSKDIILSSLIDPDLVYQALSRLGSKWDNWKSAFYHNLREEHEIVDVGLIRYPDFNGPFFLFYRLRLTIYRRSKKFMSIYQVDQNGVRGIITICRYLPDEKTKEMMNLGKLIDIESKRAEEILT